MPGAFAFAPGSVPPAPYSSPPPSQPYPAAALMPVPPQPITLPNVPRAGGFDRRVALGALAAAAVLLPLLIAVLFLRGGVPADAGATTPDTRVAAATPPRPAPTPTLAPLPTAEPAAVLSSSPVATAAPVATAEAATAKTVAPGAAKPGPAPAAKEPPAKAAPKEPPAKEPPKEPAAAGGTGTLMMVATGGTCTFQVNGATKGSGSSAKVSLAAGSYTAACKPSSGAAKSRSVTIKAGETSMVSFKLQ